MQSLKWLNCQFEKNQLLLLHLTTRNQVFKKTRIYKNTNPNAHQLLAVGLYLNFVFNVFGPQNK